MFTLIDTNDLVDKGIESGGSADCSEIVFDFGFQSEIKEQTFGIVVKAERGDGGLKFDSVSCGGLGLTKMRQFLFASVFEVAIKI